MRLAWLLGGVLVLGPVTGLAQERPLFDAARAGLATPAGPESPAARLQASPDGRDSVLDGIFIGATTGAAAGALGVWVWCQGDYKGECDDEPGQGPLAIRTALVGAGVGAVLGWVFDLNRSPRHAADRGAVPSRGRTLRVAPVASRSRKALQLTLRY